jgi:secondary thiamine-phosphate synthase enzyme
MFIQKEISLPAFGRGYHLITDIIKKEIADFKNDGLLNIFIKHTSAALSLNENADPSVRDDFESFINKLVPENHPLYTHVFEGSDDMPAHIKSSLFGASLSIPLTGGRLNLGTWQGIYLCEFRNMGERRDIVISIFT